MLLFRLCRRLEDFSGKHQNRSGCSGGRKKTAAQAALHSLAATSACSYNFTSGTNNTFLKYCVTVNGNVPQLMTPFNR